MVSRHFCDRDEKYNSTSAYSAVGSADQMFTVRFETKLPETRKTEGLRLLVWVSLRETQDWLTS